MRAFVDTSSLIKKYIDEKGSDSLCGILNKISEIIVSPISKLEIFSIIERRLRDKTITDDEAARVKNETEKDFYYFSRVEWNQALEEAAFMTIRKYHLKSLDSIQLSSGIVSGPDIFITSDSKLYNAAKKEMKNAKFI